jgi:hypothetical protein
MREPRPKTRKTRRQHLDDDEKPHEEEGEEPEGEESKLILYCKISMGCMYTNLHLLVEI